MDLPHGSQFDYIEGVPENLLAIEKMRFHFMSRKVEPKVLEEA